MHQTGRQLSAPTDSAKAIHGNRANSIVYAQFLYTKSNE